MNQRTPLLIASVALGAAITSMHAQDSGQPGTSQALSRMIRVQVEYIETDHESLTALMSDETIVSDDILRARFTELINQKEAAIMETQILQVPDRQKATSEAIEEFIYPTEYEPAELPNEITVVSPDGKTATTKGPRDFATGPTPTAFETRNLGATLEVEPTLQDDGSTVYLRFAPELVYHVKNQVWAEWSGAHGRSDIVMPVIYSMRTSTAVYVTDGHYRMVSATSPKGVSGFPDFTRKVVLFVKCDVREVGQ